MKHYPRYLLDYRLFRKAKITWKMLIIYISKCCTVNFIHLLLIQVLICYGKRQKDNENLWKKSFWAIIILFKKLKQSEIYAACSSLYKQHWDQFRCMLFVMAIRKFRHWNWNWNWNCDWIETDITNAITSSFIRSMDPKLSSVVT